MNNDNPKTDEYGRELVTLSLDPDEIKYLYGLVDNDIEDTPHDKDALKFVVRMSDKLTDALNGIGS